MPILSLQRAVSQEADNAFLSFEVNLSEAALDPVTFSYRAFEGTANSNDLDWGFDSSGRTYGTVTLAPGVTSETIFIEANTDSFDERDESVTLQLSNLSENADFEGGESVLRASGVILDNDGTGSNLALLVSDPVLVEGDVGTKEAVFEIRLSQPASEAFSVTYGTRDISATSGTDYISSFGTLNFAQGEEVKEVRVQVLGDTVTEPSESFALVLDAPSGRTVGTKGLVGEAVIRDDDASGFPVVSISNAVAREADNNYLSFEVTLSEAALDTVVLTYRALEGTASSNDLDWGFDVSDRTVGQIEFAPGVTSRVIYIEANSDSADGLDESVILQLTNLSENARFAGGEDQIRATGVILDNDGEGSNLALFVSDPVLVEGDAGSKQAVFEVRLSQPATTDFTVTYSTRDISAVAGEDYVARSGTLNFAAGEEVKSVSVDVLGDALAERSEQFALVIDAPSDPSVGIRGLVGEATIRDDDTGSGPVVSVADAVALEGDNQYLSFEVSLSEAALDTVTMRYRAHEGTASSNDLDWGFDVSDRSVGFVTFAPGQTSRIIYIEANTDSFDERDESVYLDLANLSENARFAGGETSLRATGIITDNDGTGSNVALLVSDPVLVEGDIGVKQAVFEVRLSSAVADTVNVNYQTRDITATAGSDYTAALGTLTFAPGETLKTVAVDILGDADAEVTERFALVVAAPDNISLNEEGLAGEATIQDDDTTPQPVISIADAVSREADNNYLTFEINLSEASNSPVTIDYRAREGTAISTDLDWGFDVTNRTVGTVTFNPGETSRLLYIEANTDSLDERDETIIMELSNATGASFAGGTSTALAHGWIFDDDGLGPNRAISVAPAITREQGVDVAEYEIPIYMSRTASVALSFDVAAVDQSAELGLDYRLLDSSITFLPGEMSAAVRVQILGDGLDEITETFALSVTPQDGVPFVGTIPAGIVSIQNGPRVPTNGDDVLDGTTSPDVINLLAGNDRYDGLAGDDLVRAGSGNDTVIGGTGADTLMGQAGNDFLIGGADTAADGIEGGQVFRIYRATLDRAPDTGGFEGWVDNLASGAGTILDVVSGFVASREFQNVYGSLDDSGFVSLLYNNVLNRDADAGGLAGWLGQLENGTSREQVVIGFSESAEFKSVTATEANAYSTALFERGQASYLDDVFRLYRATLDRDPDQGGLESWSTQLENGQEYTSIAAGFTNSTEFRNTYGALDDTNFVTLLYQNVLDRAPDTAGLDAWLLNMSEGLSREDVVRGFAQSREFINKTANDFTSYMKAAGGDVLDAGAGNDTLAGNYSADTFIFDAAEDGTNVVLQLNDWDTLQLEGFGYATAADALSHMSVTGADVRLVDEGVTVIFAGSDLATLQNVDYIFV
ncbi:Calx-beta domain-containing protein [uncultured Sulfitobacter sp.]|uniref:Calx-beta domain-containing protein n=1 Tax=uncultured Sulfitobacter sp. TaxID=191468 RepID=UPI002638D782|nr:Calx-beta domain-containing protein [uncultured Sulfitobacter sp.]